MMRIIKAGLGKSPYEGAARKWRTTGKFCDSVIRGWDPYRKWAAPWPARLRPSAGSGTRAARPGPE